MEIKKTKRIQWLDVLRGLAILMVVLFHFTTRYAQKYPDNSFADSFIFNLNFGWIGVHLFFMISGFIIYLTIQRKKGLSDFLVSRLSRLMPPYWAAIAFILVLEYFHMMVFSVPYRYDAMDTASNVVMVADVLKMPFLDGAFWSLYVEIKFYLAFAILWQLVDMKKRSNFYITYFVLFAASIFTNYIRGIPLGENFDYFLIFWTGIAACKVLNEKMSIAEYSFITLLTAASTYGYYNEGLELIIGVPVFAFLFVTSDGFFKRFQFVARPFSPLAFLGRISYSLYLIHQPVGYVVLGLLAGMSLDYNLSLPVGAAICFALACLGYAFIEKMDKPIANLITAKFIERESKSKAEIYN